MRFNRLSESRIRTIARSTALASVLTLASCGQPVPQAADPSRQPTTTVGVSRDPASTTTTGVPPVATSGSVAPNKDLYVNRNIPGSPLGTLCWSRREVVLSIVTLMQPAGTEAAVPLDGRPLAEVIADVSKRIASSQIAEDPQAGRFASHFLNSLEGAATVTADSIKSGDPDSIAKLWSEYFGFEGYPGIEEYLAVASSSPDCPQP